SRSLIFTSLYIWRSPHSTLFPYTTLFRSVLVNVSTSPTVNPAPSSSRFHSSMVNDRTCDGSRNFSNRLKNAPRSPSGTVLSTRRSEEHTSELQSRENLVCRLLLEKKKIKQ